MKIYLLLEFLLVSFLMSACTRTTFIKKNYETIRMEIDTISILYPHVEYFEKSGDLKKTKLGHSVFVSRKIADILKEIIDEGGFVSKSAFFNCDSIIIDDWLPNQFLTSIMNYKNIDKQIMKSEDDHRKFPIFQEIQFLIKKNPTRYFLFVNGFAFETTEETKRYDLLQAQTFKLLYDRPFVYDYQWSGLRLHIYLVDKMTKEIIWYNNNDLQDTKYDPTKDEEIKTLCKKILKND